MIRFKVSGEKALECDFVVHGFDEIGECFGRMGVAFEETDGFVDNTWVDTMLIVFLGKFDFMIFACLFVGCEGFDEAWSAFVSKPVADNDVADAKGFSEVVGAGFGEGVGSLSVFEVEEALGVPVVFGEGWAVAEVGVPVKQCVELVDGGDGEERGHGWVVSDG